MRESPLNNPGTYRARRDGISVLIRSLFQLSLLLLAFSLTSASSCFAQSGFKLDAKRPFRENVVLPVDSNLLKRFEVIKDLLADQRWSEAIGILQEIAQTESKSLVLAQEGVSGGTQAYLNVATRCNVLLSRVPAEGRAAYRQKVDPQAKRWFENWRKTGDEAELLRIVRQAFISSHGDDALLALGEVVWDRGDFAAARLWWEQLIPLPEEANAANYPTVLRYPDSNIDLASIKARILMCSIMQREFRRATDELRQFTELYPLSDGWLAGRNGRLNEILRQTLEESQNWTETKLSAEVATFGLSAERFSRIPESVDVGALRWSRPLPTFKIISQLNHSRKLPFQIESPSYHPVVYDDGSEKIVFVNDPDSIRAWNLVTGEPAWKSEQRDPAVVYPAFPDEPTVICEKPCVGVPHYTMTISNGRLYARMGSPVTCASSGEMRPELASDLVCLDLTKEGKLVWKIASHELFRDAPTWRFEGTPVVVAGRAYVAVSRRHPQLELMVACLDGTDGRLLWQRPVGSFRVSVDDNTNRISHLLLTAGGGRIFLSTDLGAILALNGQDGRLEWAVSYESRSDEGPVNFTEPGRSGLVPALFHAGYLFVAPSDSSSAFCLESESGRIHWQYQYAQNSFKELDFKVLRDKQWRHLLGVTSGGIEGRLIVSGNSLSAIDIHSGKPVWSLGDTAFRGNKGTFGRGLIAGDQILLPLRESIESYDLNTGEHKRTIPLKTPDSAQQGGNLTLAGGMLLVAQPDQLAAYWEYSRVKERTEKELTLTPDDRSLWIQLAELEAIDGRIDDAITQLRQRLEKANRDDPVNLSIRRKLVTLLNTAGMSEFLAGKSREAADYWREALTVTADAKERVDLTFALAKAEEILDHPDAALTLLQQILDDERLSSVVRNGELASRDVIREMSRLIDLGGIDQYREIETAAVKEFESLAKADDCSGLHRLVSRYPHATVTARARNLIAKLHREAGEIPEAYAMLDELRQQATDDREFVKTTLNMIELLEQSRYTNPATSLWKQLAEFKPSIQVDFSGENHDLTELARSRLEGIESRATKRPASVERTWSHELSNESRLILATNQPPSSECSSVLICSKDERRSNGWHWKCLDWRTGQTRWEEAASSPIQAVSWTAVSLLIGTPHGWEARTPENGRQVWQQISVTECTPLVTGSEFGSVDDIVWPALFDIQHGLRLVDPYDGRVVAMIKPRGRLSAVIGFGAGRGGVGEIRSGGAFRRDGNSSVILMQTLRPTRSWLASASSPRDPWSINQFAEGGEPWQTVPLLLKNRMIGITNANILVGYDMDLLQREIEGQTGEAIAERQPLRQNLQLNDNDIDDDDRQPRKPWIYRHFATGHHGPFVFKRHDELLAAIDGSQLASFNPNTGVRKWLTGLTDQPMNSPARQVCCGDDYVAATSQGILRSISVKSGNVRWERFLGDTTPQWQTVVAWSSQPVPATVNPSTSARETNSSLIAAWPLEPSHLRGYHIQLCDSETGEIVQRLRLDSEPKGIQLDNEGRGIVWTAKSISGLKPTTTSDIVEIGLKRRP